MTETGEKLMTPKDLAAMLQVPLASVYGWRHKGTGPRGVTVGRHVRYRRQDVEKWLDAQQAVRRSRRG